MPIYIRLEKEEQQAIKKAILDALATSTETQAKAAQLFKIRKRKQKVMTGAVTTVKVMTEEIGKIREALPSLGETSSEPEEETSPINELERIRRKIENL